MQVERSLFLDIPKEEPSRFEDPTVSDLAFVTQQDKQREEKIIAQAMRDGVVFVY